MENNSTAITTLKDNDPLIAVQEFQRRLNEQPSEKELKSNKQAGGKKYIPIDAIESKLDAFFLGLWETYDFKYQVVANEVVGDLVLRYFHPEAKQWLRRSGTGAVMIQQSSGSKVNDINAKIKNTLVKDMGHLKAECLKNAAKSIGKIFGRSIARDDDFEVVAEYSDQSDIDLLLQMIAEMKFETMQGEYAVIINFAKNRLSDKDVTRIKLEAANRVNILKKENLIKKPASDNAK